MANRGASSTCCKARQGKAFLGYICGIYPEDACLHVPVPPEALVPEMLEDQSDRNVYEGV